MTDRPLYTLLDGEPVLSHEAVALLIDMPPETVRAEWQRQAAQGEPGMTLPTSWAKRGKRIRKEVAAALGHEPGMKEAIDYLAAKKGN
ncbi:hypothetical protein [Allonocardiopsis opalescens]|uniref:Uncharacterized protein n=1 Tax=Allonocardiopsis opalescens TaxID=1144618 RepID=A0A2T0PQ51_9ACTN|nr:hypothetical protein [Allonocardiopsis opalescens]PRX90846.1 hypothetical protein CLV72_11642 [Allonocardiopsis opalescens]